jgi:hippurate hydrolase
MKRILLSAGMMAIVAGAGLPAMAQDMALREAIQADYDARLGALWDHFHRNPELSTLEVQTSARMAEELRALGYEVTTGVGGTGVVATLANGPGPTVLLRADMDGLPVREASGLPNASTAMQVDWNGVEQSVMHACGHDVHITALVGAARQLMERRDRWSGTLVLIAQPAEEAFNGADRMVRDGLYTRFPKPDYAVAFHVSAQAPAGQIEVRDTTVASSADSVDITVRGIGGHGAYPHLSVDPVLVAAHIVVGLQSLRSREVNPLEGAVVTVGSIHGGTKHNIIPGEVTLQLTVRADSVAVRERLLAGIQRIARNTALAQGVPEDRLPVVAISPDATPPTINDPETATRVRTAIAERMGADRVISTPRGGMGAEDFSFLVAQGTGVRGVYFEVGGTPPDQVDTAAPHHSAGFRISPEPSVTAGAEAMVVATETLLAPAG